MYVIRSEISLLLSGGSCEPVFCLYQDEFADLAAAIRTDRALYGVRPANLAAAPFELTIEELAHGHLQELYKVQRKGPYFLLGYSFGGLVAHAMAVQLVDGGHDIGLLALFDTEHPRFLDNLDSKETTATHKIYVNDRRRKYLRNLRSGRFDRLLVDAYRYAEKKTMPLQWKIKKLLARLLRAKATNVSIDLRNEAMSKAYQPRLLACRLVLFRAQGRDAEFGDDGTMGWGKMSSHGVDVHFASGVHQAMMFKPQSLGLSKLVEPYLATEAP